MAKPWISGPKELIDHANVHLQDGNPFDFRVAMISIDNAVELTIRTYLGLPRRIRGSGGPSRRELEGAIGFPELLDLLEKHGEDRLSGIELGDIEWYHRLRNTLYHDGNGVTVDPEMVDAYHQIARLLFQNLFDTCIEQPDELPASTLLGEFIIKWATLETRLKNLAAKHLPKHDRGYRSVISLYDGLIAKGIVPTKDRAKLEELTRIRNSVVHAPAVSEADELRHYIEILDLLIGQLPEE
ncbi:MAG: hypothetical protein PHD58_00030 [Anaerolineales bacterium]|nr:hypothetical protein [Anaerolineales bacterium]